MADYFDSDGNIKYNKKLDQWKARRVKIVKLKNEGKSFADIGRKFLITRERARQLYNLETEK